MFRRIAGVLRAVDRHDAISLAGTALFTGGIWGAFGAAYAAIAAGAICLAVAWKGLR